MQNLHFMDLPFYETGTIKKKPIGEEDIRITVELLEKVQPHQIYAAGDLTDPHGTHRVCLSAVMQAVERVKNQDWFASCEVWLYRGAWQEWEPEKIEMAVPISPEELLRKRTAIFKHQSQKDARCFLVRTNANSGNAPKTATARPKNCTISLALPNTKQSKGSRVGGRKIAPRDDAIVCLNN